MTHREANRPTNDPFFTPTWRNFRGHLIWAGEIAAAGGMTGLVQNSGAFDWYVFACIGAGVSLLSATACFGPAGLRNRLNDTFK